ncbi:MAG: hypothetical protein HY392_01030 [Candidatus Diapherotrites archaeon]|nr:hypothetical protein [Candidatus Diapherotrites archaeon]
MAKCVVCGKKCGDKSIRKGGKDFCCVDCLKQYEDKNKPDTKANVCEFC